MSTVLSDPTESQTHQRATSTGSTTATRVVWPVGRSVRVWLILMAFLGVVELFISLFGVGPTTASTGAFVWPVLVGVGLAGLAGIWLSDRTGFPSAWDARVSNRQRLLYPIAIGVGFGLLQVSIEELTHWIEFVKQLTGVSVFNAAFPGSLLVYPGGAVVVEVFYRLLPIPLLLWLISSLALRGRAQIQVFWSLALLTSLIEPVTQTLLFLQAGAIALGTGEFALQFAFNVTQAALFRRYGFFAAIVARWGMYLVWHVTYGNFICQC
jgi:hypothetical protein